MRLGKLRQALGVLVLFVLGCDGTSTGNPNKNDDTTDGHPSNTGGEGSKCTATNTTMLALSDPSPLGVSAETFLAPLRSPQQEPLTWLPARDGSYGPESGTQTLTVSVAPAANSARFVTSIQTGSGEIALGCGAQLEIDVEVTVKSSGGALDETLHATLSARTADVATLSVQIDPSQLHGSFMYKPKELGDPRYKNVKVRLTLSMQLSTYGVSGSLDGDVQVEIGSGPDGLSSDALEKFARFGLADCDDGIAVPLDAMGIASSQAALALLRDHPRATATALDGSERSVDFSFTAQTACLLVEQGPSGTRRLLRLAGTLAATSSDGRFAASWPGLAQTPVDASNTPPTLSLLLDTNQPLSGTTLEERYGLSGVDVSDYDQSGASVMLGLSSTGVWSGDVIAYGITLPNCPAPVPGSNSSPGCPGSERMEVEHYTFH